MIKVLTIVVTYNASKWVDKCFSSIRSSNIPLDCIVIDNLSRDNTVELIKANYPEVIIIQPNDNLGFGKGNNIGLQYAINHNYDYVYLLNQDAWIFPDTIEKLIAVYKNNPTIGILSPMQLQGNEQFLDENFAEGTCSYGSNKDIINDLYFDRKKDYYDVPFAMAAHWLISRECLLSVGGFSPVFSQYGEDGDYTERVRAKGFKIAIVPGARAIHDRENRERNRKQNIHLSYVACLTALSSVNAPIEHPVLWSLVFSIHTCLKYLSVLPLKNYIRILFNLGFIKRCRNESLDDRAFLE